MESFLVRSSRTGKILSLRRYRKVCLGEEKSSISFFSFCSACLTETNWNRCVVLRDENAFVEDVWLRKALCIYFVTQTINPFLFHTKQTACGETEIEPKFFDILGHKHLACWSTWQMNELSKHVFWTSRMFFSWCHANGYRNKARFISLGVWWATRTTRTSGSKIPQLDSGPA